MPAHALGASARASASDNFALDRALAEILRVERAALDDELLALPIPVCTGTNATP